MINAIIIDDIPMHIENIERRLKSLKYKINIIATATKLEDAILAIYNNIEHLDLLFLDIQLDEGDGFHLLNEVYKLAEENNLNYHFEVIFVTGHPEYAVEALRHNGLYLITKPIDEDELRRAFELFKRRKERERNIHDVLMKGITLSLKESILKVNPLEVIYLEADGNMTKFYLSAKEKRKFKKYSNSKFILVSGNLKSCINKYFNGLEGFYRVHKSYFINIRFLAECRPNFSEVTLVDDSLKIEKNIMYQKIGTAGEFREAFRVAFNSGRF